MKAADEICKEVRHMRGVGNEREIDSELKSKMNKQCEREKWRRGYWYGC